MKSRPPSREENSRSFSPGFSKKPITIKERRPNAFGDKAARRRDRVGHKSIFIFLIALFGYVPYAFSQQITVTGRITDQAYEGIPGVNVIIKGTAIGTATDLNGRFAIRIEPGTNGILVISFVGYNTEEVIVGQQTVIDVQLTPNLTELDEIVVTGYSSLMKKDIASSIAVVDVNDMKKIASSNIADQLQGKVAGVQVATSGEPGSFQYVRIRGIGSINNNEPLYVIDGVPVQNETNMNFLNPNDIESMQVLKDASASIYGARAANGVIVITTKRGAGKTKVNFDFFTGIQDPLDFPELITPEEQLQIQQANSAGAGIPFNSNFYIKDEGSPGDWRLPDYVVLNRGYPAGDPAVDPSEYVLNTWDPSLFASNHPIFEANKEGTKWFDELYNPASMTSAQLSVSGGSENGTHFFSMNYYDYNGILIENKWKRIQARLNNTFSIGKNVRVGENLNVSFNTERGVDSWGFQNVGNAYTYLNVVPIYDINGYYAASSLTQFVSQNPVAQQQRHGDGYKHSDLRLTGNAFVEFDFLKNFTFKTNAGVDFYQGPTEDYQYTCPECATPNQSNKLVKNWDNRRSWVLTSTLNYNLLRGKHNLYSFVGAELRDAFSEGVQASGNGLRFGDDPNFRELSNAESDTYIVGSNSSSNSMVSAFVNANYTLNGKYILAATLRTDGSSRFVNNRFGTFAGVSGAWRISLEPFFAPVKMITDLKLRASYGASGNNEVVGGDYPGYSAYGTTLGYSSYPINGTLVQGFGQVSSGNPDLKWETSILTNFALDVMLEEKFSMTLEWYNRKTNDMIYGVDQPLESGNVFPINLNVGSMVNRGIDMQLSYRGSSASNKFLYTIGLTGTHYANKVLSLDANENTFLYGTNTPTRTQAGFPVSQLYGYAADGLWQSQLQIDTVLYSDPGGARSGAKPGRMKFQDTDGNGVITDADRTFIGNPHPKFILGLNIGLNYKNFDLTTYISGVFGKKVYNSYKVAIDRKKRFAEAGKTMPVYDLTDTRSFQVSSYWVEDASFLKIRNIDLGYTIPGNTISKLGMSKARVYFQIQNLFTWTNYSGLDPDVTIQNFYAGSMPKRDLSTGFDYGRYAPSRQFIIGVNIEF